MFDRFTRLFLRLAALLTLFAALLLRAGTARASTTIVGGNLGSQTWTPAGSPYIVTGDSTVQVGATLTIQPGVTVQLATGDAQAAGIDHSRIEITIQGTLNAVGTAAAPITFKAQGASAAQVWYGIVIEATATATISYATIQDAWLSVSSSAPGTQFSMANSTVSSSITGVTVMAGTPTLDHLTISGANNGVQFSGTGGGTVSNSVISDHKSYGIVAQQLTASSTVTVVNTVVKSSPYAGIVAFAPTSGLLTLAITNSTIQDCSTNVDLHANDGTQMTVTIKNSIISQGTYFGIRRGTSGTVDLTTTYSNVWGNGANYTGTAAGVGCISQNPTFVNPPLNLALQASSVCIDAGTSVGAPAKDILGVARPINGDGLNGAEFDMGAYEFKPAVYCGDGVVSAGETCDSGAQNGTYGNCKSDCSGAGPSCGDGVTNGPEACDDGNLVNTDACKNDCTAAKCGDGVVSTGEECDDGNLVDTDACLTTCAAAKCGDGAVQVGVEACDDGNAVDGDACTNLCAKAKCGDGVVQAGVEACDDGNTSDTDGCLSTCVLATCGDGFVQTGVESCDDGNAVDNDGCKNDCKNPSCGDGVVQRGEACDDGNAINTDGCLSTCVLATCGDGFVQTGVEACDDGNTVAGDGCSSQCTNESASTTTTGAGGGGAGGGASSSVSGAGGAGVTGAGGGMSSASGAGGEMTSSVTGGGGGGSGSTDTSGGCGCRTAVGEEESSPSWLLFAAAVVVLRRRRTDGSRSPAKRA